MENERFDRLIKGLATGRNRRGLLKGLFGGAAAVVAGGATRRSASATHNVCRHEIAQYCSHTEGPEHECCAPNYVCATPGEWHGNPGTPGTGCQCNTAEGFIQCGHECIHESHCCTNDQAGCPDDQVCHDVDGDHECVDCQAAGEVCNIYHPCCHPGVLECTSTTTDEGTCCVVNGEQSPDDGLCCSGCLCPDGKCCHPDHCPPPPPECVPVTEPCNKFHPCCHPEQYVCSSTTEEPGECEEIEPETCDETKNTLCEAEGFKSKCCPGLNRPCNRHKNGTFDCGKKPKNGKQRSNKRKR
jgi:hypothetical protein